VSLPSQVLVGLLLAAGAGPGRNHLGDEKSPYLLEHAHNPVWWWTWTPEALAEAKKQDKPIFLSIGYSTCHWCHVMERESFEDAEVAAALNRDFIAIKVDREERPDLDAIYMRAVEAMTGRGGWPMTTILTPDGKPFFGGTYFPKSQLLELLKKVASAWKGDRPRLEAVGAELARPHPQAADNATGSLNSAQLIEFAAREAEVFDSVNGGSRGAPKFPPSYALRLLMRIDRRKPAADVRAQVTTTLDAMARGGIYDHVGGGFHRYSTDDHWGVPHYEKMLYDQAALANAYLDGYSVTGNIEYALVVKETLDYVLKDMTSPAGAFFSAEDADSEGVEGKFYLWRDAELRALLSAPEWAALTQAFELTPVLHLVRGGRAGRSPTLVGALAKMAAARSRRPRPRRDDKVITAWNGLMIGAFARAARGLDEPRYAAAAARAAHFVLSHNRAPDGALTRRWRADDARYPATLSDYANLIDALLELYQADFDPAWLREAAALEKAQEAKFSLPDGSYALTDGSDASLLERPQAFEDNVEPAGTSVAAWNLLRLADFFLDDRYRQRAAALFGAAAARVRAQPSAYPLLLSALDFVLEGGRQVVLVGALGEPAMKPLLAAARRGYLPNTLVAAGPADERAPPMLREKVLLHGRPTAYVCEQRVCKLPTHDPAAVAAQLSGVVPLESAQAH